MPLIKTFVDFVANPSNTLQLKFSDFKFFVSLV